MRLARPCPCKERESPAAAGDAKLGASRAAGGVALVAGIGFCAALALQFWAPYPPYHHIVCLANVKNVALAWQMYEDDYGACPPAAKWQETMMNYVKNPDIYRCPKAEQLRSGFAYNDKLAGQQPPDRDRVAQVTLFETDRGWDADGGPILLPRGPRHEKGDNYGFADGHARWYARKNANGNWFKSPQDALPSNGSRTPRPLRSPRSKP